jgi:DNA mismatch repair protein MutL
VENILARRKWEVESGDSREVAVERTPVVERFVDAAVLIPKEVEVALGPELVAGLERFRFVGRLGERFVVMEDAAGMVLLDHRAARERIWFERTLRQMASGAGASQRLLLPAVVELAPRDEAWVRENARSLGRAGLLVEPFGRGSVKVDGVPPLLGGVPAAEVLLRLIDDGRASGASGRARAVEEAIARSVARFAPTEDLPGDTGGLRDFLGELMACDLPYTCPSGKPTLVHLSFGELERKFGRG